MAYVREVIIERALVEATTQRGGIAYKLTVPGRANVPDRLLLLPGGRAIFVECKAPGQSPRAAQQRELERLAALGFETYTLDSTDNDWIFEGTPPPTFEIHQPIGILPRPYYMTNPRRCAVANCRNKHHAHGLCAKHYMQAQRLYGAPQEDDPTA